MSIIPVRVFFQKQGRLKYISHLDTMSLLMKALARTNLPVWYTEGYNPHIYLTICLPLSLGYEGIRECFDIKLTKEFPFEQIKDSLNQFLPEELSIIEVIQPVLPADKIAWADYDIENYYPNAGSFLKESFEQYINQKELIIDKKSKRGTIKIDLIPYIKNVSVKAADDYLKIGIRLATGSQFNINPRLIWQNFSIYLGTEPEGVSIVRKQILDEEEKDFR